MRTSTKISYETIDKLLNIDCNMGGVIDGLHYLLINKKYISKKDIRNYLDILYNNITKLDLIVKELTKKT